MSQPPQSTADISSITSAQRAQILREEMTRLEAEWMNHQYDNIRDLMIDLGVRIDELERDAQG
jgi:hypothetical protein